MKYDIDNIYFAKCRHCVMDIVNVIDENGQVVFPHPDYVDYYTILILKNGKYVNIYNKDVNYKYISQVENDQEYYYDDLIIEMYPISNYVDAERMSIKDCELVDSTIQKTKSLNIEYGYKKNIFGNRI